MDRRFAALFCVGIFGAIATTGWRDSVAALKELGWLNPLILLALAGAHYVIRALRWHLLARSAGLPTSLAQNALHFFGGFAMTATPGRLGELVRLRWIGRATGWRFDQSAPIAFADRAIELAGMITLIVLCLGLSSIGTGAVWQLLAFTAILIWIAATPTLLVRIITRIYRMIGRGGRLFVRLRRMIHGLEPFLRVSILVPITAISVIGWAFEGIAFALLLNWLDAPVGLWAAAAIFLISVLSGALSGLPGGLGSTEASIIALLLLQGVSVETSVIATAVIRLTTLWFAILIGIFVFPVAEIKSQPA